MRTGTQVRLLSSMNYLSAVFGIALTMVASGQSSAQAVEITVPPGSNLPGALELELMAVAFRLMLFVVIPVLLLTVLFAWRFRASNVDVARVPQPGKAKVVEILTWFIPAILILLLGTIVWRQTHLLDPYRSLNQNGQSTVVQAIALDWKWLFVYPDDGIAVVNELAFPNDRPLSLRITSDVALNSFMIRKLGGQIYAMAGMETQLNLKTEHAGSYQGRNMQFSGDGFADQTFMALAMTPDEYREWIINAQSSEKELTAAEFVKLQEKSVKHPVTIYRKGVDDLFESVIACHRSGHHKTDQQTVSNLSTEVCR
ncbi:MAG: COX aromatic rich motif-containing protein [Rhizobiaceae bacterium]